MSASPVALWLGKEAGFHASSKVCDPVQIEPVLQVHEKGLCSRKTRWLSSEAAPGFHLTCPDSPGVCVPRGATTLSPGLDPSGLQARGCDLS